MVVRRYVTTNPSLLPTVPINQLSHPFLDEHGEMTIALFIDCALCR